LEFDKLRVPPIQISTKKGQNLCFVKKFLPKIKSDGIFGNCVRVQEQKNELRILKFYILRVIFIQTPTKKGANLSYKKQIGAQEQNCHSIFKKFTF
jgi:hypothetical protein